MNELKKILNNGVQYSNPSDDIHIAPQT